MMNDLKGDNVNLIDTCIEKYRETREEVKRIKERHKKELEDAERLQSKREEFLLEKAGIEAFSFMTELFVHGREGKRETKKNEEEIGLNQAKIESWLLKMLSQVGEGIKTEFGTVYKTRKESVTCSDFESFVKEVMLQEVTEMLKDGVSVDDLVRAIHLEYLTKAVRKEAVLELMGEADSKGQRPNPPPPGVNYVAVQTVGVRKK